MRLFRTLGNWLYTGVLKLNPQKGWNPAKKNTFHILTFTKNLQIWAPDVNFFNHFFAIFPCKTPKNPKNFRALRARFFPGLLTFSKYLIEKKPGF